MSITNERATDIHGDDHVVRQDQIIKPGSQNYKEVRQWPSKKPATTLPVLPGFQVSFYKRYALKLKFVCCYLTNNHFFFS